MIRHTVLFTWTPGATREQKSAVAAELSAYLSVAPSARGFRLGPDAGLSTGNSDFGITVDFDDEAGFFAYANDPAHREIISRTLLPITAGRTAVQFEY